MQRVLIGCSGWNYADWRGPFYPERGCPTSRWLEFYAREFPTVEINSTFYRLASRNAVARWLTQTPEDFVFAPKISRYITHMKRLTDMEQAVDRFYERIEPLAESPKLGPVLWQLPENFHRNDERLANALDHLPPGRHAFEFRHASWFDDTVLAMLRDRDVALVIGDDPRRTFQPHVFTTDFTFIRFHYGTRGRGGNYSRSEIEEWAERIREWRSERAVFAYYNNDWNAFAIRNAKLLTKLVSP
ncbi:MAG: hypothetical protein QOH13_2606 [Thermoleophilaceae bacterium]|nr:hypothetical protein [Thermoleophilaceae bacterium]